MRHSVFSLVGTGRLSLVISACFSALLLGCSTLPPSSKTTASKRVEALDKSLAALKAEFNRDPSKPRLVALFSPTCGGCIYGAEALQHEAQKLMELSETTGLLIVWVSMLETDNEVEARKAAARFDFQGVQHFYDAQNEVGRLFMAEQLADSFRETLETLPADHPMRKTLEKKQHLPPEKIRLWDSVLVFPPGVKWADQSPKPEWWTIQSGSRMEEKPGEKKVVFWKNKVPVASDWYDEAREALRVAQRESARK